MKIKSAALIVGLALTAFLVINTLVAFDQKVIEVDSDENVVKSHIFSSPVLDLERVESTALEEIHEFTTIAIPVGMIFSLFYFYRRKR
jgi:hypothetical protein